MKLDWLGLLAIVMVVAVLLGGCSVIPDGGASRALASPIGDWVLWQLEGEAAEVAVPRTAKTPTLRIAEDGQISGTGGVNQYTGSINVGELGQGVFQTGPLASTRMMGASQAMALERRFLDLMQQAERFECDGRTLTLRGERNTLLRFERATRE